MKSRSRLACAPLFAPVPAAAGGSMVDPLVSLLREVLAGLRFAVLTTDGRIERARIVRLH